MRNKIVHVLLCQVFVVGGFMSADEASRLRIKGSSDGVVQALLMSTLNGVKCNSVELFTYYSNKEKGRLVVLVIRKDKDVTRIDRYKVKKVGADWVAVRLSEIGLSIEKNFNTVNVDGDVLFRVDKFAVKNIEE